ncbi:MAG: hypothetical protein A3J93_00550 [Candidatus Magasanikbacteria bacterium RIFOXYC2_FULL_42_28]|uniref:Uncharacterized protein n=1 Tax=Candidatus Magasanikbacteria bacterium RIFOXYC2_FULL_42_28 TaxID=1798704 RepID=A0A1F6NW96_9BACT|nr:MAG: hypothetical protein A3J93_00550 [Candidatus Magasanikbacteria bacterium RIFOXYC2_FULL_42_28]
MTELRGSGPREISNAEAFAIKMAKQKGALLAGNTPQIADDVRAGMSIGEIAKKYDVAREFGVTDQIAYSITKAALDTFFSPEERKAIFAPRLRQVSRQVGLESMANGVGLFGRSPEKRKADSRSAGQVGGAVSKELGKGIFSSKRKEYDALRSNRGRVDGWRGGKIVDGMDEAEYTLSLLGDPSFRHPIGHSKAGHPDVVKITRYVNEKYGNNRSINATKHFFANDIERTKNRIAKGYQKD